MPGRATWELVGKKAEGVRVKHGQGPLFWFWPEGMKEAGEVVNFNNFSGLPDVRAHPSYLVPGYGVIKREGYWLPVSTRAQ